MAAMPLDMIRILRDAPVLMAGEFRARPGQTAWDYLRLVSLIFWPSLLLALLIQRVW